MTTTTEPEKRVVLTVNPSHEDYEPRIRKAFNEKLRRETHRRGMTLEWRYRIVEDLKFVYHVKELFTCLDGKPQERVIVHSIGNRVRFDCHIHNMLIRQL